MSRTHHPSVVGSHVERDDDPVNRAAHRVIAALLSVALVAAGYVVGASLGWLW